MERIELYNESKNVIKTIKKGKSKMNNLLVIFGYILTESLLEQKKNELENKNDITNEEDILYVQICEILKEIKKITIKFKKEI